jgi:hypothetical protein
MPSLTIKKDNKKGLLVLSKTEQQQLKGERYAFSEEGLFMLAGLLKI